MSKLTVLTSCLDQKWTSTKCKIHVRAAVSWVTSPGANAATFWSPSLSSSLGDSSFSLTMTWTQPLPNVNRISGVREKNINQKQELHTGHIPCSWSLACCMYDFLSCKRELKKIPNALAGRAFSYFRGKWRPQQLSEISAHKVFVMPHKTADSCLAYIRCLRKVCLFLYLFL